MSSSYNATHVFTGEGAAALQAGLHSGGAPMQRGGRDRPVPPHRNMGSSIASPSGLFLHTAGPYHVGHYKGGFSVVCITRRIRGNQEIHKEMCSYTLLFSLSFHIIYYCHYLINKMLCRECDQVLDTVHCCKNQRAMLAILI